MSNYLNWAANKWAAYAFDKGKSYVIGQHSAPDPDLIAQAPTDPATGKFLSPPPIITSFKVDCIHEGVSSSLGVFSSLADAQAAAQADASS